MTFLSTLLSSKQTVPNAFCLVQSSAGQSTLPLLRALVNAQTKCQVLLVCSLYAPATLLGRKPNNSNADVRVIDWTEDVPGYGDKPVNQKVRLEHVQRAIKESSQAVVVVVDSVDTYEEDLESPSEMYRFLSQIVASIISREDGSRLICHISARCSVLPLLKQPRFSSSLIHLIAHPPELLLHIARAYLTSPPSSFSSPDSPATLKFWRIFVPLSSRPLDIETLVFGSDEHAEGSGSPDDFVVEILIRGRGADVPITSTLPISGIGKPKGVERILEGWSFSKGGPVSLEELVSLKNVWHTKPIVEQEAPDPTKDLTFNLNLTDSQQTSRSQVPLPYEHNGRAVARQNQSAHIFYDPDSADDLDDEDPDEDLDL